MSISKGVLNRNPVNRVKRDTKIRYRLLSFSGTSGRSLRNPGGFIETGFRNRDENNGKWTPPFSDKSFFQYSRKGFMWKDKYGYSKA